ncbi:MAG: hypothetical protein ACFHWX_06955 [Bacteroidota bacterium]
MIKGKALLIIFCLSFLTLGFAGCKESIYTVPIVKNKKRLFPFDASKDRKKKRTKIVKYKVKR